MAGTGGPGPPKNNPTVEPRIKNIKYRPKVSHVKLFVFVKRPTCCVIESAVTGKSLRGLVAVVLYAPGTVGCLFQQAQI